MIPTWVLVLLAVAAGAVLCLLSMRRIRKRAPGLWWRWQFQQAHTTEQLIAVLQSAFRFHLAKALHMTEWSSFTLRGFPGDEKQPELRVGICVLRGDRVRAQDMEYFRDLHAPRVEIFVDRTHSGDAAARLASLPMSSKLAFLVTTDADLVRRFARVERPIQVLHELIAEASRCSTPKPQRSPAAVPKNAGNMMPLKIVPTSEGEAHARA